MANYDPAFVRLIKAEGKFGNNKADRGNWICSDKSWVKGKAGAFYCTNKSTPLLIGTMFGIAAPTLASHIKRVPSVADMKGLKLATAKAVYKNQYWNPLGLDGVSDQTVAELIFDGSVNQGTPQMKTWVASVTGTNVVSKMVEKINANPSVVFEKIKKLRESRYKQLGGEFLEGWMNRLSEFKYSAKNVAKNSAVFISNNRIAAVACLCLILAAVYLFFIRKKPVLSMV